MVKRRVHLSAYVPNEFMQAIENLARREGISISRLVEQLLAENQRLQQEIRKLTEK